jgi:flagella basal body P-ring formation protein FlgA
MVRGALLPLLLLLLLLLHAPSASCAEGLRITLKAHAEVAGRIITIGDIAELDGEPALAARIAAVTMLELTDLGEHRLTAAQVQSAAAAVAPGRTLQVAGECRVSRRALVIAADALVAAAVAAAGAEGGLETVATKVRDGGAVIVPDDALPTRLVAEALDHSAGGEIPYRVRVLRGESELARTLVTLQVTRYRAVAVAARNLRSGELIAAADVRITRMAMDAVSRYAPEQGDALVGESARLDIAEGTPLAAGLLRPHLDVHGGTTVTLVFSSAGFEVSGSGEALSDGKVGDVVQVRRSSDGSCVKGKVSAPGEVRVNY